MNKCRVFCFAIVLLAIHSVQANPLLKGEDAVEYENYVNCVQEVQNTCEKSGAPFEVLVQGPNGNRFVRSLVLADVGNAEPEPIDPKQVSTFSIYQPKHIVKRDIESDMAEIIDGAVSADTATIDEQTVVTPAPATPADAAPAATATADKKDGEEKVGLALPVAPLVGLQARLLAHRIGINKAARLLPIGVGIHSLTNPALSPITNPALNPVLHPELIPVQFAALRARLAALPIGAAVAAV